MKLLVTGATGFLGSTLLPLLRAAGHRTRALVRSGQPLAGADETVQGDVRDTAAVVAREGLTSRERIFRHRG